MGLGGALSNREAQQRFARLDELRLRVLAEAAENVRPTRTIPRRPGTATLAVIDVLNDAGGAMRARDIRLAVERRLR